MQLPEPIYKSLPLLYILIGVVALITFEMPFSVISALLFITASLMIWKMRKHYRHQDNNTTTTQ